LVDPDALHMVTPDAKTKPHFVIVDAVGVCEDEKRATKPLDRKPTVREERNHKGYRSSQRDAVKLRPDPFPAASSSGMPASAAR